jgi:HD-like signal output (HDOD) protein
MNAQTTVLTTPTEEVTAAKPLIANPTTLAMVDRYLAGVEDLHSAPPVVRAVLDITRRLDYDVRELADTITSDPVLSAKVLRLVNSATFALPNPVTSIRQAVTMVGQRTLRLLVLTFSLVDRLTKGLGPQLYFAFWRQSLTTALVAGKLARSRRGVDPDTAYSIGLLSNLGTLALAQKEPIKYPEIFLSQPDDESLVAAEREAFGCDHAQLGARLLERWGFSAEGCSAVLYHHELRATTTPIELVVLAASMTAEMMWNSNSTQAANARSLLRVEFDCDTDKLIGLVMYCRDELSNQADLYGIESTSQFRVDDLIDEARKLFTSASIETAIDFDSAMRVWDPARS